MVRWTSSFTEIWNSQLRLQQRARDMSASLRQFISNFTLKSEMMMTIYCSRKNCLMKIWSITAGGILSELHVKQKACFTILNSVFHTHINLILSILLSTFIRFSVAALWEWPPSLSSISKTWHSCIRSCCACCVVKCFCMFKVFQLFVMISVGVIAQTSNVVHILPGTLKWCSCYKTTWNALSHNCQLTI